MAVLKNARAGTLTTAVCWCALAVIASFWGSVYLLSQQDRARTLIEVDDENRNLARTLSEHAARTLDYADSIALRVKALHEKDGRGLSLERFGREAGLNRKIVAAVAVVNARGDVVQMDQPFERAQNLADRDHFKAHRDADGGKPVISRPLQTRMLGRTAIFLTRRLNRADGSFDGIVSVVIDPNVFTGMYREVRLGAKSLIVMTGRDGFIRARNSGEVDVAGQNVSGGALFSQYAERNEGTARYASVVDGVTRRVAFRQIEGYPLILSAGVAEETVLAEVNDRARNLFLGALAASLLALSAAAALLYAVRRRERDAVALRNSEALYRRLVEDSPDATFVNRDETILYANAAFLQLLGATSDAQIVGKSLFDFLHPDFHAVVRERMARMKSDELSGIRGLAQRRYVRFDGRVIDVEVSSVVVQLPDGPARHIVARDITSRKKAEAALQESMERYRRMVEEFPDAVFINRGDAIVFANPAALRMVGAASAAEVVGKSPLAIVHPDDRAEAAARIDKMVASGEMPGLYNQRFLRSDGSVIDAEVSVSFVFDQGLPSRQVVARDITQRRQIEAALRDSQARYRRLVEESPDATIISRRGVIFYANPAALRLLGAQAEDQVVGSPVLRFLHPDYHADAEARFKKLEEDPSYSGAGLFERKYVRLDGVVVDVEISGVTVQLADGPARHIVIRDVSERKKIEVALRDSEERYRMLVDSSPDAVIIYTDDKLTFVNPAAVKLFGAASAEQLIGMTVQQLIHPSGEAVALARRAYVMKTGLPTGLWDQTFLRLDGTPIEVEGSAIGIPGTQNRQRLVTVRDISARKRAEEALRESEERMRIAVDAANLTTWEWDIASDVVHWGSGHEKLLGPLPENLNQYPDFRKMVHPDDRTRYLAIGRATMAHGVPYDVEFGFVRTDGVVRRMRSTGRAVRDAEGRIVGMVGVTQDVTHRHDIERELAVSQQRRDALLESIPAPAWLKDRNGRFVAVNRAWYQRFKQDPGFAIGRTNAEVFPPAQAAERDREDQLIFATRKEQRVERMVRVDGNPGWFETVKMPVFDEKGEVTGIVGISFDTTARKQAEEQLRASEERFRLFADSVDDVFWMIEPDPVSVIYVNKAFTEIWGFSTEELQANSQLWFDSIHPEDRDDIRAFENWIRDDSTDVYRGQYRIVRRDGGIRWIRDYGTKLRDASGKTFRLQGIAEDVTAQHNAEVALLESRRRRDALLQANPDPAWLKDLQGRYVAVNHAWFTQRGLTPHNIEGRIDRDYFSAEQVAIIDAEDRRVIETKQVLRSERNWNYNDGTAWIETVKAPVVDSDGNVTAIVGLSHDITERKRSEQAVWEMNTTLEQKTAELTALNRELEAFAYTVSHDLRAPLRHIDGFVNLLKNHAGPTLDAQSTRYFDRVSNAARRMGHLIDDLLAFSRTGRAELHMQRVQLERLVRDTIEHLKPDTAARRIEWKVGVLPAVYGDAGLLAIVLQNLVSNAIKYTRPCEVARIEISAALGDGGMTTLTVRDNGVGFDMQYANKLFGVFQRLHTDAEFEGTGIGLATVARIVQRHGGGVRAEGRLGEGSSFHVTLPQAPMEAKVA